VSSTRRSFLITSSGALATAAVQPPQISKAAQLPSGPLLKPGPDAPAFAQGKWSVQYLFDKERESLAFGGLQFASPLRGVATATRFKDGEVRNFLALRTTDGGKTWMESEIGRAPYSLFVLDESNAWIVCENRLLYSDEGGARWRRLKLPDRKMTRVHFRSPTRGWAFGAGTVFFETSDGGKSWRPVKESLELKLNKDNTLLNWMEFVSPKLGMMAGTSRHRPVWDSYLPEWMIPERAVRQRMLPGVVFTLVTGDGGATWRPVLTSAFGELVRIRLKGLRGLGLLAFDEGFDWPSEITSMNLHTGASESVFRKPQFHITDMALVGDAGILLAGVEAPGRLRLSAVTGKIKAIYSPNGKDWYDMKVDYRAEGAYARIARAGDDHFWLMSGSGMILKLTP
jgi:hypothetical protein